MIRIDDSLLEEIGLISLPKADRDQMLRQIYETLEMRVGMRLAERMSDQQLDEFERFIDTNDEAGALKWLEANFPDYKQVVAEELDKLKAEIKKDSAQILATMQQQGQQVAAAPAPQVSSSPEAYPAMPQQQPFAQQAQQPPQPAAAAPQAWADPVNPSVSSQLPQQPTFQTSAAPSPQPFNTSGAYPAQPLQQQPVADPAAPFAQQAQQAQQPPTTPTSVANDPSVPSSQQDDAAAQSISGGPSIPPPPTF